MEVTSRSVGKHSAFGTAHVPSALELQDGTRCDAIKGASEVIPGTAIALAYTCEGEPARDVGQDLRSRSGVWSARVVDNDGTGKISNPRREPLTRIWFARR